MQFFEKIIEVFTLGRKSVWDAFEDTERYTIAVFHNGRRPMYQILRLDGKKWKIEGRPYYSSAWANEKIKLLKGEPL